MAEVESVLAELTLLPSGAAVARAAGQFAHAQLCTFDALHLATARRALGLDRDDHFVTYDKRLWQVAAEEGLRPVAPGS